MPFRLLADECFDGDLVLLLRQMGHDVRYVAEGDAGRGDDEVLQLAVREDRVLLTEDTDFGELVVRLGKPALGIILLRLAGEPGPSSRMLPPARSRSSMTRKHARRRSNRHWSRECPNLWAWTRPSAIRIASGPARRCQSP